VAGHEPIELRAYSPASNTAYSVDEGLTFEANSALGSVRAPVKLNANTIVTKDAGVPKSYQLSQNYPNPFNAGTVISYYLAHTGTVKLDVFDVLGRTVRVLIDESQPEGNHQITWDGRDQTGEAIASGVYFYRLVAGDRAITKKMVVVK